MTESAHIQLGTKATTLRNLRGRLSTAKLLAQYDFAIEDWSSKETQITEAIASQWPSQQLAIRSSAVGEDSHTTSRAGAYLSLLNVASSPNTIREAVEKVIASYGRDDRSIDPLDRVLVMPMITDPTMSGVAFSRDLETGAPYIFIHYDDLSRKTDTITSGAAGSIRLFTHCKLFDRRPSESSMSQILALVLELEALTGVEGLDIEFAFSGDDLYLLQARPISVSAPLSDKKKAELRNRLDGIMTFVRANNTAFPNVSGSTTAYGIMPDWNPAEIIGTEPRRLAFSTYKELITDVVWAQSRRELGYRDVSYQPGISSLGGKPYVDVRMSFNTFLPQGLPTDIANRLVDYYILKLRLNQDHHDKVEFKVVHTCYPMNQHAFVEELSSQGFSAGEINTYRDALFQLTRRILMEDITSIEAEMALTQKLAKHRAAITKSDIPPLIKIAQLVHECKRHGTLPFAKLARFAFIGTAHFREFKEMGILTTEEYNGFMSSIPTVATDFVHALYELKNAAISHDDFIEAFGHLRPGTYDICSKSYREAFDEYCDLDQVTAPQPKRPFTFSSESRKAMTEALQSHGYELDADDLIQFTRRAIAARERAKFEFSKNIDMTFSLMLSYFGNHAFTRDDLSHLDLKSILRLSHDSIANETLSELHAEVDRNRADHHLTKLMHLPPLLFLDRSVQYFTSIDSLPTFVTEKRILADITVIEDSDPADLVLQDRIAFIENADPGYDWIFTRGIKGLVTAYGGAASHMAIRSAEFGTPAAIGCGATLFNYLKLFRRIEIDCGSKQIREIL